MITKIKVYYEDTDASGRVYYANYLKFLERGRTDFLYNLGLNHKTLFDNHKIYFVVKSCNVEYIKSAYFEDILLIETSILNFTKAKIEFKQQILRDDILLLDSKIIIVSLNYENKISKMPNEILNILEENQI